MTVTLLVIIIVLGVLAVAGLTTGVVLGRRRRISITTREQKPERVGEAGDKSAASGDKESTAKGGYRAGGGISLAPGGAPKQAAPSEPETVAPLGESTARPADVAVPGPAAPVDDESIAPAEPATDEPSVEPAAPAEPAAPVARPGAPAPESTTPREPAPPIEPAVPEQKKPEQAKPEPEKPEPEKPQPQERIEPTAGRLQRLRGRLARSRSTLGQGLLGLLGAGDLDDESWEEVEDTLLLADLGAANTTEIVDTLREQLSAKGVRTPEQARAVLRSVLVDALHPELDRAVHALPHNETPAVVLLAGVNGTGKTTTTGKLARVLVADGRTVLLGAADTFRAAAAEQLQTWADRVGAEVVRGKEGDDPAAVAFDAAKRGVESKVDAVLVDTAGRLHTKAGLMDELGKVKRVIEKQCQVDEVLLVLDATTGQNGLTQARVFREVVDVTGIVLTKLDGTAKGGIVFQVQRELGVPVKLVGLGEGADDLAPFEPAAFVDALLD